MQTLSASSWLTKLGRHIVTINQKQATGDLIISNGTARWRLCFFLGQLIYAIGENHRVRRWQRALKKHCPDWAVETHGLANSELWECQLLHYGTEQGYLNAAQVKAVVQETTQEVFFSIAHQSALAASWQRRQYLESQVSFYLTLSLLDIQQLLFQSQRLHEQWQEMGLNYLDPDLAPLAKQSPSRLSQCSADTFVSLTCLFNGRYTLWDITLKMKQPIARVGRLFHYFRQQGEVELQTLPDFPPPVVRTCLMNNGGKRQPAIACVDDSPLVGRYLEEILVPAGYRVLYIQDPVQGIATLAKHKPDLIFLDLVMPNTNGYNVCRFLRRSSDFSQTPIVMLTSCDGLVNRVRAKLVGADDFLGKPFETKQLMTMIQKYVSAAVQE